MALSSYQLPILVAVLSFLQNIHGQLGNLVTNPKVGQSVTQGLQSSTQLKSNDNLFQNDFGKSSTFNSLSQQQSSQTPQAPSQSFTLHQMQSTPQNLQSTPQQNLPQSIPQSLQQLINQQPTNLAELQKSSILYQPINVPQSSFIQQPSYQDNPLFPLTQPGSLQSFQSFNPQSLNGNIQIPLSSLMQQIPVIAPNIPLLNSYVPTYSSASGAPSCGCERTEFIPNLGGNYAATISTIPLSISEPQLITSLPYQAVISTSNPTVIGNNVVNPYQNQVYGNIESPLEVQNDFGIDEEIFETDNLTSLLLSLLQRPTKSAKCNQCHAQNPYSPFGLCCSKKGSKSSNLKALLPVILNLLKERRETPQCLDECKVSNRNKFRKDHEPQINGGYSKKRDYSFKEEMFRDHDSEEQNPRTIREHKKGKKIKKVIPTHNSESNEKDYDGYSEEQDD